MPDVEGAAHFPAVRSSGVASLSEYLNPLITSQDTYFATAAYELLRKANLLESRFRLETPSQIDSVHPNASRWSNLLVNIFCVPLKCCGFFQTFEVPAGHVTPVTNGSMSSS